MDKKKRFENVVVQRTNKILKMLELLGNCSNKGNYEYTEIEVEKIFKAIDKTLEETKQKFKNKNKIKQKFSL